MASKIQQSGKELDPRGTTSAVPHHPSCKAGQRCAPAREKTIHALVERNIYPTRCEPDNPPMLGKSKPALRRCARRLQHRYRWSLGQERHEGTNGTFRPSEGIITNFVKMARIGQPLHCTHQNCQITWKKLDGHMHNTPHIYLVIGTGAKKQTSLITW